MLRSFVAWEAFERELYPSGGAPAVDLSVPGFEAPSAPPETGRGTPERRRDLVLAVQRYMDETTEVKPWIQALRPRGARVVRCLQGRHD